MLPIANRRLIAGERCSFTVRSRRYICGVLFLLTFLGTTFFIRHLAGLPEIGPLKEKLLYFAAHKDSYDVVFVGSSRVQRGIIPPLFDEVLSTQGSALHSFNFAIAGMKAHEANALIRRVLEMKPARLRWVVVEIGEWDPVIRPQNRFKRRGIFWHDAAETSSVLRSTLRLDKPLATRMDLLMTHGLHFAARSLGLGRGPEVVHSLLGDGDHPSASPESLQWQGFKPYDEDSYQFHPLRQRFLKRLDEYRQRVERLSADHPVSGPPVSETFDSMYNVAAIRAQVDLIRRAGASPVHVITPVPTASPELDRLHDQGHVPTLLAFNRPTVYPDLFAVEHRFDAEHLTQEGAETFTRLLASSFAAEL